jgi:hypothetical protein
VEIGRSLSTKAPSTGQSQSSSANNPSLESSKSLSNDNELLQATLETDSPPSPPTDDRAALHQLYAAASKFGVDQLALNEFLLSRSGSVASNYSSYTGRTTGRSPYPAPASPVSPSAGSGSSAPRRNGSILRDTSKQPQTQQAFTFPPRETTPVGTNLAVPRFASTPDVPGNAVIRRTLYIASDPKLANAVDAQAQSQAQTQAPSSPFLGVGRKPSVRSPQNTHKRSTSISSVQSVRSVTDRAPTPPPNRSARRKSAEASPPVPQLPSALSQDPKLSPTRNRSMRQAA